MVACLAAACLWAADSQNSQTIDRIVARIEGDIILLSEVRDLAAYQQLMEGRSQPEEAVLRSLIEQWVVRNEAMEAQFPEPAPSEIDAEMKRIQGNFASAQAFRARLAALGLSQQTLRKIVEQQVYLERFLDYKFRPAVQVDEAAIASYYQSELAPALRARNQTPPPLEQVREQIREVLIQRGINERADAWFEETKSRLQIETEPLQGASSDP